MIAAIRSEYRKFFSTRSWWLLSLGLLLFVGLTAGGMAGIVAWDDSQQGAMGGMSDMMRPMVYGLAPSLGYVFPAIIGAFAWTNEYRHKTIIPTFLGEPRRLVVCIAKAVAGIPMGFVIGVIGSAAAIGGGALGFTIFGADAQLGMTDTWEKFGLSVLTMTLWAIVGVGLGMLVTSQIGVIIILLLWTQLVEPLLRIGLLFVDSLKDVPTYLPGSLGDSIIGGSIYSAISADGQSASTSGLPLWEAAVLLAAYGLVFGILGYFLRIRRDVN